MPKNLRRAMLSCASCTLMLLVTCGLACNVFSAAQPYILAGNGFTNTQTSLITTIRSAAYLLGTLAVGRYYRRIGYRAGCALSAVLVSVSFVLFAAAKSLVAYYFAGAVAGIGYAFGSMVPASILMRRWFRSHCGLAIGVCAAGTGLAACGIPALTRLSFPGTLSLAPQIACYNGFDGVFFGLLAAPVTALLLEFLNGERLWCRFVCPQGLLLGCAARLRSWCGRWSRLPLPTVRWEASCCSCKGETPCAAACTLGVQPRRKDGPDAVRCSICGECVSVCARKGRALRWKV